MINSSQTVPVVGKYRRASQSRFFPIGVDEPTTGDNGGLDGNATDGLERIWNLWTVFVLPDGPGIRQRRTEGVDDATRFQRYLCKSSFVLGELVYRRQSHSMAFHRGRAVHVSVQPTPVRYIFCDRKLQKFEPKRVPPYGWCCIFSHSC